MTASVDLTNQIAVQSARSSVPLPLWKSATWEEYMALRDDLTIDRVRLFYDNGSLLVHDMGFEGINHAKISDLLTLVIGLWFIHNNQAELAESLGRCLLEKPQHKAGSPDLVLYLGEGVPQWQEGEPRRIDLTKSRPNLVGEISDTTLATDLDEKKHLYASLGIPEYWVIDVRAKRVFAFRLQENIYQQIEESIALAGLPIVLVEQTIDQLIQGTNISVANWFTQQIQESAQSPK